MSTVREALCRAGWVTKDVLPQQVSSRWALRVKVQTARGKLGARVMLYRGRAAQEVQVACVCCQPCFALVWKDSGGTSVHVANSRGRRLREGPTWRSKLWAARWDRE